VIILFDQNSLFPSLSSVFPEIVWFPWCFEEMKLEFWKERENISTFFNWMWSNYGFVRMEDLYSVTEVHLYKSGAIQLLGEAFHSPIEMIVRSFPSHPWRLLQFDAITSSMWRMYFFCTIFTF